MNALILDEHRRLFRDDGAFEEYVQLIRDTLRDDFAPVVSDKEVLGAVVSPEAAKEMIFDRIAKRLAQHPSMLADVKNRLETNAIVDIDGIH